MNSKQSDFIKNIKHQLDLILLNPEIKILNGDCDTTNHVELCYFDGMGEYAYSGVKTLSFTITYKVEDKNADNY